MRRPSLLFVTVASAALLAACQSYSTRGIAAGTPVADVQASMGTPTGTYALPGGGQRLEFARGPFGKHTYMVDVDAAGRVQSTSQVLTEPVFATVQPGMSRDEVLRTIGHPSDTKWLGYQKRKLWSYRYDATFCLWYQVSLDTTDTVVDVGYATDPMCEVNDRPE